MNGQNFISTRTGAREQIAFDVVALQARSRAADRAFQIELARSQRVLTVPEGQTITDVLFDNDIPVDISCEAGICGACRTTVLDGIPDHRDAFLTPANKARNDCMMLCVSRCSGERLRNGNEADASRLARDPAKHGTRQRLEHRRGGLPGEEYFRQSTTCDSPGSTMKGGLFQDAERGVESSGRFHHAESDTALASRLIL